MKILLLAVGSDGDVRPFTALGTGLAALGHEVALASFEAFRGVAAKAGIGFSPIRGNPMELVHGEAAQAWLSSMNSPLRFLATTSRMLGDLLDSLNDDVLAAAKNCDCLICSLPLCLMGQAIADALGIVAIPAGLYPMHPTRAFPFVLTPTLPRLGGIVNLLSGSITVEAFWLTYRHHLDKWRKKRLGLSSLPLRFPYFSSWARAGVPVLYGFSPSVIPRPSDWKGSGIVCGYWFLDADSGWSPPASLLDFLKDGPAPVYVGFGSMASEDPEHTAEIVLEVLRRNDLRAVLASGWGGYHGSRHPPSVFPLEYVPHDWLFQHVIGAVHHGGAGTTAATIRAGIPSVVVPFFADQFFWGSRLNAMGLAPAPVAHRALTVEALDRAVKEMVGSPDMRARCAAAAKAIASERGVENAAAAADRYLLSVIRQRIH